MDERGMKISFLIPVYNESGNIEELCAKIKKVSGERYSIEVVFVNDGSTDNSLDVIKNLARHDRNVKAVDLSRNFGHQTAIKAGLGFVTGDAVIVMDADLQDPPEVAAELIDKWRSGYQVVYAIRRSRKEPLTLRVLYASFYRILKTMSKIDMPLDAGDFCLLDREVADVLISMPERNPFMRGLRSWVGYKQIGVEYDRQGRFKGKSKYGFFKLLKLALDGIFSFSNVPLRISTISGFAVSIFTAMLIIRLLVDRLPVPGTTLIAVLVLFMGGVQLITIGILGEYIGRIYEESKKRPSFLIKEKVNI
jgi:dolichol-phosphate mannosyltransferase